jgi:hypothetical protein
MNRYRMLYRPAGYATLPRGVKWEFVEAPALPGLLHWRMYAVLPPSRHLYGVIETDRPLTQQELNDYQLEAV